MSTIVRKINIYPSDDTFPFSDAEIDFISALTPGQIAEIIQRDNTHQTGNNLPLIVSAVTNRMIGGQLNSFKTYKLNENDYNSMVGLLELNTKLVDLIKKVFGRVSPGGHLTVDTKERAENIRALSKKLQKPITVLREHIEKVVEKTRSSIGWDRFTPYQPKEIVGVHLLPRTVYSKEASKFLLKEMR